MLFWLPLLLTVLIDNGFSLECYSNRRNVDDKYHEETLPTESCEGRCYIRSNQNTQQVIMRGCTTDFADLPNTGCYMFPTDTWCLCADELCNFGPMGWGEYNAPHVRMGREINVIGRGKRNSLQHTLRDPFKEEPDVVKEEVKRDPEIDRYRAVENLGVGLIKSDAHAKDKFAISDDAQLATDWPKVSLRMGNLTKSEKKIGKFSLHQSPPSRPKRKQKRFGSIFTKEGRIVHNQDFWTDEWGKKDWQTPRHRQQQTTRPRKITYYDQTTPKTHTWGQNDRVYERNTMGYTAMERTGYQNDQQSHHDRGLHDQYGLRQQQDRQINPVESEELESWEAEGPVEIDDTFWDFSALIESGERKPDSVTEPDENQTVKSASQRQTTKRAWSPQTTTPVMRESNYQATTTSPVWTHKADQGRQPSATAKPTTVQTQSPEFPVPSLIGKSLGILENESNMANDIEQPNSSSGVKKTFTKGFFYKNPGTQNRESFPKITTKRQVETTPVTTTEKTTPSTTQEKRTTTPTPIPTTEPTTITTTLQRTTTLPATTTTTTPVKTTVEYRKLAKAERHKSALPKGGNPVEKGSENEVQENCGSYSGKKSGKGCRNQPLRIITHDTQTSGTGPTATTLKSVLQTALHLNISTLPVRDNDTRVNGSTSIGQSDGFTGLSSSNRLEAAIRWSCFLPLIFGLFNIYSRGFIASIRG